MNEKMSVFVICVETIIYLWLHNLHDRTFKSINSVLMFQRVEAAAGGDLLKKAVLKNYAKFTEQYLC